MSALTRLETAVATSKARGTRASASQVSTQLSTTRDKANALCVRIAQAASEVRRG